MSFIQLFMFFLFVSLKQQRDNRPSQQQVQKIASESMIPTYRSGADSLNKSNQSGNYSKQPQQQQQQQNNSSSFSANAPKAEYKNAVNNESNPNPNPNQCNSPVKRRSTSQTDVRISSCSIVVCCVFISKFNSLLISFHKKCMFIYVIICCSRRKKPHMADCAC